jgi:hypothetical protein
VCGNPALVFEPVQGRVERSLAHRQSVARERLYPLRDSPTMKGLAGNRLEDQACNKSDGLGMTSIPRLSTIYLDYRQTASNYL